MYVVVEISSENSNWNKPARKWQCDHSHREQPEEADL